MRKGHGDKQLSDLHFPLSRMNVHVPGQPEMEDHPLDWWWALISVMVLYCIVAIAFGKRYGLI